MTLRQNREEEEEVSTVHFGRTHWVKVVGGMIHVETLMEFVRNPPRLQRALSDIQGATSST